MRIATVPTPVCCVRNMEVESQLSLGEQYTVIAVIAVKDGTCLFELQGFSNKGYDPDRFEPWPLR